jgi:hypothetical protein
MSREPRELYAGRLAVHGHEIPRAEPGTHTMGGALDAYVRQRIPARLLAYAREQGIAVEVHGVYPAHAGEVFPDAVMVDSGHRFSGKWFNHIRPHCFLVPRQEAGGGWTLVVAVPPGRDYVLHYASLVSHFLATGAGTPGAGAPPPGEARAFRYPAAEAAIASWTGLDAFVRPGDRLLLGYVQELLPLLTGRGARVCSREGNDFYGSIRLRFPRGGACVNALGVRYSFWGDISGRLAAACAGRGAVEVIYAGKLGALTRPADIYSRLFLPSSYVSYGRGTEPRPPWPGPPNGLLERYPHLDSGAHMSVGTVLEEDLAQRAYADRLKVNSIDNEISQMAQALTGATARTAFSALHFATDYLNGNGGAAGAGFHNLASNRQAGAVKLKKRILNTVADLLYSHYDEGPPAPGDTDHHARHDGAVVPGKGTDITHESILVD